MKAKLLGVLILALVGLAMPATAGEPLELGATAPKTDVAMKNVDGKLVEIKDVVGPKGTLVVFSCNACPFAQAWEKRIVALGNEYEKKGIGVVMVNSNDPARQPEDGYAEMQERAKRGHYGFPYVVDATQEVASAFGASRTPEAFLFDAKGKLVYHGTVDDNARNPDEVSAHWLSDALAAVVGGKPVPVAETKALGCTIKWHKG